MTGSTPMRPPPAVGCMGTAVPTPAAGLCSSVSAFGFGAGRSTAAMETTCSPRSSTKPSVRFSSLSPFFSGASPVPVLAAVVVPVLAFDLKMRYSSVSASTRFMCRSNARNVPISVLPSFRVTRMRQLMNWSILPLVLTGGMAVRSVVCGGDSVLASMWLLAGRFVHSHWMRSSVAGS